MRLPRSFRGSVKAYRAFTLLEVLIVTGLITMLGAFGAILGFDSIARTVVIGERDLVVSLLNGARTRALANVNETAHGIHIGTDEYVLFEGTSYPGTNQRSIGKTTAVSVSGPVDIIFAPLAATTTGFGTLIFTNGTKSATIEVNTEGRIDW